MAPGRPRPRFAARERARRAAAALFPGDRRVWAIAAAVVVVLSVPLLVSLLKPREVLLGSNSIAARNVVASVGPGETMCLPRVRVPGGTGKVRFAFDVDKNAARMPVAAWVRTRGGPTYRGILGPAPPNAGRFVDVPIRTVPGDRAFYLSDVCIQSAPGRNRGPFLHFWGQGGPNDTDAQIRVEDRMIDSRLSLWFLPGGDQRQSIVAKLPDIFQRATLFRPDVIGAWTYWALLFAGFPLLLYGAVRLVATADRRRGLALVAAVGAIGFAHAAAWAVVTPAFHGPDESEHASYVQHFAENGKAVDAAPHPDRPVPWSSDYAFAIDAVRAISTWERPEAKPPWLWSYEGAYRARLKRDPPANDNGGGAHPALSSNTPAYYATLAPAYYATERYSVFSELLAMRLTSALWGALTAALAAAIVLELLPGRRGLAAAAGLLVALQPMFGFISGAVNNDNGVNALAALALYLTIRGLRRGFSVPLALGLGAALAVAPLMKGSGYMLLPPVLLALGAHILLRRRLRDATALALGVVAFLAVQAGWTQVAETFDRGAFTTPGGGTPVVDLAASSNIRAYLVWMWQVMIPFKLPFMQDFTVIKWPFFNIYIERGFGAFGWYAITFPLWVYGVIVATVGVLAALGARALWLYRSAIPSRLPSLLLLVTMPMVVIAGVEFGFFNLAAVPYDGTPEQGRYAFTAITAVAALAVGACLGFGRRWALPAATALVMGLGVMAWASQFLTLSTYYS